MLDKLLGLFGLIYSKKTVENDNLDMVGYSDVVIKFGKKIITYRKLKDVFKMVQYINGVTEYSLLKEYKDD